MLRIVTALIAIFAFIAPLPAGELIPFTLPWDDDAGGITDLSSYNHTPAGKFGYISVDQNAHFSVGGERIRFWGVNITASSCFPTHAEAEAIAARLAKFGFNIVRFHHMDNNWGGGSIIDYSQGNSRNLHTGNLERLDYFIAQLKAHGIYSNINLINSRDFMPSDGLDPGVNNLGWKGRHVLGFVDTAFRNLEKEFAANLLTHINPYTGLSYIEDPAIAVVEVNNENGIFHRYFSDDDNLTLWPDAYKNQLQDLWNAWLQNRYADTAELLAAWSGESEPLGAQLVANSDFSSGTASWNIEQREGATASASAGIFDGRQGLRLDVTAPGSQGWYIQLNQSGKSLTDNQLYALSFRARADVERSFSVAIGQAHDPWQVIHPFDNLAASTSWQQYTFVFESAVSDTNLRINFNNFATETGPIYFTDITLHEGGSLVAELPAGQSLEAGNIASNVRNGSYLPNRILDWTRFLTELATDYWTDMHAYIKTDLGYGGLVNGTTIMNSTPNIQGVYDVVDTHSYWKHPDFPGTPWDPNNWTVDPESMVNDLVGSTLGGLARQRVDGYPHTVSEYRHSYPNPFASEGPLIVAAYAALQDWDGIYFFDYARGHSWDQGYFNNYFNMNAHPSSMANARAAANLFRRGDVSAASGRILMNFNPDLEIQLVATQGKAWNVGDGRQLGIPPEHVAVQQIALSIGENAIGSEGDPPPAPVGPVYTSDTAQLSWDKSVNQKGVITINTPKTRGVVGFINGRSFDLDGVRIDFGTTQEDWATLTLSMQDGYFGTPHNAGSLLIVATGLTENTNMVWTDASKNSVGSNWGNAPSLVEAIPATITLPFAAERSQAWALDESGQRDGALTVTSSGEGSIIEIGNIQKSLWYEVSIEADLNFDPYTDWRNDHFDTVEQANDAISGQAADPDGDSISNLFEFFADLDPKYFNTDHPVSQTIEWLDQKPLFVYAFSVSRSYGQENIAISASQNLVDWSHFDLQNAQITITSHAINDTHDRVRIEFLPNTYSAFTRLKGN